MFPGLEFEFWRKPTGGAFAFVQAYAGGNTYTWTPANPGDVGGTFVVEARVRRTGSSAAYEALRDSSTFTVVAAGPPAVVPAPTTVNPGETKSVTVVNGPGNTTDWVGLYPTGAADTAYLAWQFLSGTTTPPAVGVTGATLSFTAPMTPGTYNLRFFSANSYTKLATSATITVTAPTLTPTSTTVAAGAAISVTVANGPGNATDWVGLYSTAAADGTWVTWQYLSGTTTPPGVGLTGATLLFTAPMTAGTYNLRMFPNNAYTKLATSAAITVP